MTSPLFRFWSDVEVENLPPTSWVLDRILPTGGLGVVYGESGAGKSFFSLGLAVAVALDRQWLDRAVHGGRVVYIAAEGSRTLGRRLSALKEWYAVDSIPGLTIVPDAVYLHHASHLLAYLTQLRDKVPAPIALTVIDTLSRCSAGSDENSNADRELTVDGLNHIRSATDGAILVVHHTGWNTDRMRGGYSLQAAADTVLALKRSDGGVELKVEKQRDDEAGEIIGMTLQPFSQSLVVTLGVTLGVLSEKGRKLLRTLNEIALSDGVSTTVWKDASGLPGSSFYLERKPLVVAGYVEAVHGAKRWIVSEAGRALLQTPKELQSTPTAGSSTLLQNTPPKGGGVETGVVGLEVEEQLEREAIQVESAA